MEWAAPWRQPLGSIVWAKMQGYSYWPAEVCDSARHDVEIATRRSEGWVFVRFFGWGGQCYQMIEPGLAVGWEDGVQRGWLHKKASTKAEKRHERKLHTAKLEALAARKARPEVGAPPPPPWWSLGYAGPVDDDSDAEGEEDAAAAHAPDGWPTGDAGGAATNGVEAPSPPQTRITSMARQLTRLFGKRHDSSGRDADVEDGGASSSPGKSAGQAGTPDGPEGEQASQPIDTTSMNDEQPMGVPTGEAVNAQAAAEAAEVARAAAARAQEAAARRAKRAAEKAEKRKMAAEEDEVCAALAAEQGMPRVDFDEWVQRTADWAHSQAATGAATEAAAEATEAATEATADPLVGMVGGEGAATAQKTAEASGVVARVELGHISTAERIGGAVPPAVGETKAEEAPPTPVSKAATARKRAAADTPTSDKGTDKGSGKGTPKRSKRAPVEDEGAPVTQSLTKYYSKRRAR